MLKNNNKAFTLIEALVVIAIIATLSVFYVLNLRSNTLDLLRMDSARLAADIRYVRSMAASRAVYNNTTFPTGGYGIRFKNGAGATKSYYQLYAGDENNIIKTVELANVAFRLVDSNAVPRAVAIDDPNFKKFAFLSENSIYTSGLEINAAGDYQVEIYYDFIKLIDGAPKNYYYIAKLNLGRKTADDFVWSNLSVTYETNTPVCGNVIVESGEDCEPLVDGVRNPNCLPPAAGETLACHDNSCGDGFVAGGEECEKNSLPTSIGLTCSAYWCYSCSSLAPQSQGVGGCSVVNADGSITSHTSCCGGTDNFRETWNCVRCTKITYGCLSACPDGELEQY
jgi:prepilin-type N-terminal cleavage/methylation domain-containing protein